MSERALAGELAPAGAPPETETELALSVVVPVYNLAGSIQENVAVIRERIAAGLGRPFELVVVSDGSVDSTEERLLASRSERLRVIHYDRNLGKGYAVKAGALAARGRWIAFVDADLDLDPGAIPDFLAEAEADGLDFAIGSKRHPDSIVRYPRSRRVASWLYQQAVRLLFHLNVRDTQVGLKVFRREVADDVLPLLLVKRYAFDLELLAVASALGYGRIRELPVRLDYQFTGSGVRSLAVARALLDTLAIFYRLRILRTYERKRRLLEGGAWERSRTLAPLVSLLGDAGQAARLDYERFEPLPPVGAGESLRDVLARASGELVAILEPGAVPAGNWLASAIPFFARADVAAVVCPTVAPDATSLRGRAAAAIWESRLGGGSLYFRFTPGNLRVVGDFPTRSLVVRRASLAALGEGDLRPEELCARLADAGGRVVYTPETVVVAPRPPLVRPHFREVVRYARSRAASVRRRGLRGLRPSTLAPLALLPALAAAAALAAWGSGSARLAGIAALAAYGALLTGSALLSALRFRSFAVGLAAASLLPPTHLVYAGALVAELARAPRP